MSTCLYLLSRVIRESCSLPLTCEKPCPHTFSRLDRTLTLMQGCVTYTHTHTHTHTHIYIKCTLLSHSSVSQFITKYIDICFSFLNKTYSITSVARTRMARLPWMIRTLFFSPYKILPIAQENKYLGILFSYFIMELYVVCIH